MIRYLKATGSDQYAALQAAIDALIASTDTVKVLVLDGLFSVSAGLVAGSRSSSVQLSIAGVGETRITYTGARTTDPVLTLNQCSSTWGMPVMSGVAIYGAYLARGITAFRCTYADILQNVRVQNSIEVGIDFVNCWGSCTDKVKVQYGRGIAMRFTRGNTMRHTNGRVWQMRAATHASGTTASDALADYEMVNGRAAAKTEYGEDYLEWWPAEDDETVLDFQGNPVQTPDNERAAVVVRTTNRGCQWHHLQFETNRYGDSPLVFLGDSNWGCTIKQMYVENNYNRLEKVLVRGPTSNSRTWLYHIDTIPSQDGVTIGGVSYPSEAFLRLQGHTGQIKVSRLMGHGYTYPVLCDGGIHEAPEIVDSRVWSPNVTDWITAVNGAVIKETASTGIGINTEIDP